MIDPEELQISSEVFNPYENVTGKKVLVSVGRMSPEKHIIDAVDVMHALKEKGYSDLLWYLIGDGIDRNLIENRMIKYGVEDCFYMVGNVVNPYPYIGNADLFIHPSWMESQGIAVLEAMALKKPCVVVKSDGTNEFSVNGYNSILADRSIDDLSDKVEFAIKNLKNLDFRVGQEQTIKRFSPEAIMNILNQLLSEG